jgi:hypothetical protein
VTGLDLGDLHAIERKLAKSKKENRKRVTLDMETAEYLLAYAMTTVKDGKAADRTAFTIEVVDYGDHAQVYRKDRDVEVKLGNIWRREGGFEAEDSVYGKKTWQSFTRALAYIIYPKGIA